MSRFAMIYTDEATDMSEMTSKQGAEVLAKWQEWMGRVGDALADVGTPFGPDSVVDDGSQGTASSLRGYSIVTADDLAGAKALADGYPYLSAGEGDFAIDIYELVPVCF